MRGAGVEVGTGDGAGGGEGAETSSRVGVAPSGLTGAGEGEATCRGGSGGGLGVAPADTTRLAERVAFKKANPPTSRSMVPITMPDSAPHQRALNPRWGAWMKGKRHHSQLRASRGFRPPQPGQRIIAERSSAARGLNCDARRARVVAGARRAALAKHSDRNVTCQAYVGAVDPVVHWPRPAGHAGDLGRSAWLAQIIAIANQKGGVGKTTTAANLGASLALRGQRVLLVDLDPQGNLTSALGQTKLAERTVAESLLDRNVPLPVVTVENGDAGQLDLAPSSLALASAEAALMNKLGRELRLRDQLAAVEADYTHVLIDTPPSLGLLTINALVAATRVIVPTEARFFSLQGLQMLEESIEEILYLNPRLKLLGIMLSKFDRRLKEEKQVSDYLRKRWGTLVFETEVGTNSKILEAGSVGTSVFRYAGAERAVEVYVALAEEVLRRGQD
jgi:chromosome partitioning protein